MKFINWDVLNNISRDEFYNQKSFPHIVHPNGLTKEGYQALVDNPPDEKGFSPFENAGGPFLYVTQLLSYYDDEPILPDVWNQFIRELNENEYLDFIEYMLKIPKKEFFINPEWNWTHYSEGKMGVEPHLDDKRKLGVHFVQLNTEDDWNYDWGGELVTMKSNNPNFHRTTKNFNPWDMIEKNLEIGEWQWSSENFEIDSRSGYDGMNFLMKVGERSWHGIKPFKPYPKDYIHKLFVINIQAKFIDFYHPNNL